MPVERPIWYSSGALSPQRSRRSKPNESFSQTITYELALYHVVWVPKYRHRILTGWVAEEVARCVRAFTERQQGEVVELNVQIDHVHLLVMVPPKVSVSDFVGTVKGRTAMRVFNKFRELKRRPYWGNRFWARGYCVDTVGLHEAKIRAYVRYQEERERRAEQRGWDF
jgi:putative transposase